jgi:hypothetical protein
MKVSAVIPTRGNVELGDVLHSIYKAGVRDVVVYDNSGEWEPDALTLAPDQPDPALNILHDGDLSVYGRYAAIEHANSELIYTQDDDCVIEAESIKTLIRMSENMGGMLVANMPHSRWPDYTDSCLVGWGACFHRDAPAKAFAKWPSEDGFPPEHYGVSDVWFTTLTMHMKMDLGFSHLPWAEGPDRMFKQPGHKAGRDAMLELARQARNAK